VVIDDDDDDKAVTTVTVIIMMMIIQLYVCRIKHPYDKKAGFTSSASNFFL
jgi:hypothetical protein